jgi:hypothetical protein
VERQANLTFNSFSHAHADLTSLVHPKLTPPALRLRQRNRHSFSNRPGGKKLKIIGRLIHNYCLGGSQNGLAGLIDYASQIP